MPSSDSRRQPVPKFDRDYHDADVARHYAHNRWGGTAHARRTDRREHAIVEDWVAGLEELDTVIDGPCGAGRFLPHFIDRARLVAASDESDEMLKHVAHPHRVRADAMALPFATECADLVFCFRLVHHFATAELRTALLAELERVSRRWVIVSYFDRRSLQAWRNRIKGKTLARFPQTSREFEAECAAAGLRVAGRRWTRRGISEQVIALLEKA